MFEITAKHLKECFPELKIGGPALAWNEEWAEDFLREMQKRNVPLDFFSWHIYCTEPSHMTAKAQRMKKLLNKYGYENAESILNEWNYVKGWEEEYVYSLKAMHGIKGAAFVMSCMCEAQRANRRRPMPLSDINATQEPRMDLLDGELNRVLGGGLVPGSLVLLGGEPGIGKRSEGRYQDREKISPNLVYNSYNKLRQLLRTGREERENMPSNIPAPPFME